MYFGPASQLGVSLFDETPEEIYRFIGLLKALRLKTEIAASQSKTPEVSINSREVGCVS